MARMRDQACAVEGCSKRARVRGWCAMHYERWRLSGDTGDAAEKRPARHEVPASFLCPVCGRGYTAVPYRTAQTCSRSCGQRLRRKRDGHRRIHSSGYVQIWAPDHPLAHGDGYVLEHRMVAWDQGILTDPAMHVHHINHDKQDNRPENLEALEEGEHHRRHIAEAGYVENQYGVWPVRRSA